MLLSHPGPRSRFCCCYHTQDRGFLLVITPRTKVLLLLSHPGPRFCCCYHTQDRGQGFAVVITPRTEVFFLLSHPGPRFCCCYHTQDRGFCCCYHTQDRSRGFVVVITPRTKVLLLLSHPVPRFCCCYHTQDRGFVVVVISGQQRGNSTEAAARSRAGTTLDNRELSDGGSQHQQGNIRSSRRQSPTMRVLSRDALRIQVLEKYSIIGLLNTSQTCYSINHSFT